MDYEDYDDEYEGAPIGAPPLRNMISTPAEVVEHSQSESYMQLLLDPDNVILGNFAPPDKKRQEAYLRVVETFLPFGELFSSIGYPQTEGFCRSVAGIFTAITRGLGSHTFDRLTEQRQSIRQTVREEGNGRDGWHIPFGGR